MVDEVHCHIEMPVNDGEQQGCAVIRALRVQIGAALDQNFGGIEIPLTGCVHQWRQPGFRISTAAGSGISAVHLRLLLSLLLSILRSLSLRGLLTAACAAL